MSRMTHCLSVLLVVALVLPTPIFAGDHLLTRNDVAARLEAARAERATNQLTIDRLLAGSLAAQVARERGLDIGQLRTAAATLSDEELRDLAVRADALETDPVAGSAKKIVIIVIVVVVVLAALVVASCKEQGADCVNK